MRFLVYGPIDSAISMLLQDAEACRILANIAAGNRSHSNTCAPDILAKLSDAELVVNNGTWLSSGPRLIIMSSDDEARLRTYVRHASKLYADRVISQVESIKSVIAKRFPNLISQFGWSHLSSIIIGGFLLDLAVGSKLYDNYAFPDRSWVICYQYIPETDAKIGVRVVSNSNQTGMAGIFWDEAHANNNIFFTPEDVLLMRQVHCNMEYEVSAEMMTRLIRLLYIKGLEKNGAVYRLNIPVFEVFQFKPIESQLTVIASRIVEDIITPDLEKIADICSRFPNNCGDYWGRLVYNRLLMEATYHRLVGVDIVGRPLENNQPGCWGTWLWVQSQAQPFPFLSHIQAQYV